MGEKYIRFVGDSNCNGKVLSDGRIIKESEVYWVRVEPIKWLVDEKANIALAKKILFSGVQFKHNKYYIGDFNKTIIKQFMDKYFSQEIKLNKSKKVKNKKERKTLINDIIRKHYITKYLKELYFIYNKLIILYSENKIDYSYIQSANKLINEDFIKEKETKKIYSEFERRLIQMQKIYNDACDEIKYKKKK